MCFTYRIVKYEIMIFGIGPTKKQCHKVSSCLHIQSFSLWRILNANDKKDFSVNCCERGIWIAHCISCIVFIVYKNNLEQINVLYLWGVLKIKWGWWKEFFTLFLKVFANSIYCYAALKIFLQNSLDVSIFFQKESF